jgi:hypothetical protein
MAQAVREQADALIREQDAARRKRVLARKRASLLRRTDALRSEFEAEEEELRYLDEQADTQTLLMNAERSELARLRQADATIKAPTNNKSRSRGKL